MEMLYYLFVNVIERISDTPSYIFTVQEQKFQKVNLPFVCYHFKIFLSHENDARKYVK